MVNFYRTNLLLIGTAAVLFSCSGDRKGKETINQEKIQGILISDAHKEAAAPYLTEDQNGNPMLCWTEASSENGDYMVRFSIFDTTNNRFTKPGTVYPSAGTRIHPENMNKIAVKADGTFVAAYGVKYATEENPFAGAVLYTLSTDQGATWSVPDYLHSDTSRTYGRGYFDLVRLSDGEVGAVWLDGRFREERGSALFFAKTEKGGGFSTDLQIGEGTCECCRTDLEVDKEGKIHVAYRDILFPSAMRGKQVRDMVHIVSIDGGKTFTEAQRISADNWEIEGCPHTGPSLAANRGGLHAAWFTAAGDPGIYYTHSENSGNTFLAREKITEAGKHPQLSCLANGDLVLVWDEIQNGKDQATATHAHHGTPVHDQAYSSTRIVLQLRNKNGISKIVPVTSADVQASHAVVAPFMKQKVIVAWTQSTHDGTEVYYQLLDLSKVNSTQELAIKYKE